MAWLKVLIAFKFVRNRWIKQRKRKGALSSLLATCFVSNTELVCYLLYVWQWFECMILWLWYCIICFLVHIWIMCFLKLCESIMLDWLVMHNWCKWMVLWLCYCHIMLLGTCMWNALFEAIWWQYVKYDDYEHDMQMDEFAKWECWMIIQEPEL